MICPKCGKTITDDSVFCEYCGSKVEQAAENATRIIDRSNLPQPPKPQPQVAQPRKASAEQPKKRWLIPALAIAGIAAVCVCIAIFAGSSDEPAILTTDAQQMNLKGAVESITETSYYTCEEWEMSDQRMEDGGFFDGATFLSVVYGGEHLAYNYIQNFFFQNMSDCEMKFSQEGNIYEMTSLCKQGGHVIFSYYGQKEVQQIDAAYPDAGNQNAGVTDFSYTWLDGNVQTATMTNYPKDNPDRKEVSTLTYNVDYGSGKLHNATYTTPYGTATVNYNMENSRISSFFFPSYDHGENLTINISYNDNNDIEQVTWDKGTYGSVTTDFWYEYDSNGNWTTRHGSATMEYERDGQKKSMSISIRTVREITYR
jgi:hypothetical protein